MSNGRNNGMRGVQAFFAAVAITAVVAYCYQKYAGHAANAAEAPQGDAKLARGKYLVTILACADCHTPMKLTAKGPMPDEDRALSGHPEKMTLPPPPKGELPWVWSGITTNTAFAGPWGITYAANLTPDKNTGLGIWDEKMFVSALRTGKHYGQARPIQPPMPWPAYAQMTDEDLSAIFAYLKSIPPIRNQVPDYQPPQ